MVVIKYGAEKFNSLLIEYKMNIKFQNDNETLNYLKIKDFIQNIISENNKKNIHESFVWLCYHNFVELVKYFLSKCSKNNIKVDMSYDGYKCLKFAVSCYDNIDIVKFLLVHLKSDILFDINMNNNEIFAFACVSADDNIKNEIVSFKENNDLDNFKSTVYTFINERVDKLKNN